jgi:hypothetical protein
VGQGETLGHTRRPIFFQHPTCSVDTCINPPTSLLSQRTVTNTNPMNHGPENHEPNPPRPARPPNDAMLIVDEAATIVHGERQQVYGPPLDNHSRTAALWNAYLSTPFGVEPRRITARDVCMMNILQKISRDRFCPKRDNLVDIAGFAENAQMCEPSV